MRILTDRDDEALAVLRHSTAHVMAEAVLHLWPDTKVAIGPAIADGFYYDFEFSEPISAADLERIEAEMRRILAQEHPFQRTDGVDKAELLRRFEAEHQPYKLELARDLPDGEISLYTQDGFEDLCRGPHLQTTKPIKAFKLLSTAGAYWRGDAANTMLTRIYGTAFFTQQALDEHLDRLEEARRRDHRRLGRELDLFHMSEISPGSPFWHPARDGGRGTSSRELWRELNGQRGYREVQTPILFNVDVWTQLRALGGLPREHVLHRGGGGRVRPEADELPGPRRDLRATRAAATATCRCGWPSRGWCTATSRRARCTACCGCATSPRTTPTSSAPTTRSSRR